MTGPREREIQLSLVPQRDKQGRDVPARWAWTEPSVWTERMLAALDKGVKGGKWFSPRTSAKTSDAPSFALLMGWDGRSRR